MLIVSKNCRVIYKGNDYAMANNAFKEAQRLATKGDRIRTDNEYDFDPHHPGAVRIPSISDGSSYKWVLTTRRWEK